MESKQRFTFETNTPLLCIMRVACIFALLNLPWMYRNLQSTYKLQVEDLIILSIQWIGGRKR